MKLEDYELHELAMALCVKAKTEGCSVKVTWRCPRKTGERRGARIEWEQKSPDVEFRLSAPDEKRLSETFTSIPKGFRTVYLRTLDNPAPPVVLVDILALVGIGATEAQVAAWPLSKQVEAQVWAATEHARASDNPVPRHPKPSWVPQPWCGKPSRGEFWDSSNPTPIEEETP